MADAYKVICMNGCETPTVLISMLPAMETEPEEFTLDEKGIPKRKIRCLKCGGQVYLEPEESC